MDEHTRQAENSEPADQHELRGMTAVVTGSSSGIGRAIACELARAGASVGIHGRKNQAAAEETARFLKSFGALSILYFYDLADDDNLEPFVNQAWSTLGQLSKTDSSHDASQGIDIWINNAGADVLTGSTARRSFAEKLDMLWQVDVAATVHLSRLVGRLMKQRGSGVIINIGWDQAEQGMAGDSGELFATVKGAVMAFTRSLAQSLAPQVRVNCVAPGWIKTAWGEHATPYWQQRACRESLLGRWGTPEDVARVVRFVASPQASFITGQNVQVNGGFRFGSEEGQGSWIEGRGPERVKSPGSTVDGQKKP